MMLNFAQFKLLFFLLVIGWFLTACTQEPPAPTPMATQMATQEPTAVVLPSATSSPVPPTPTALPTSAPTETALPPTPAVKAAFAQDPVTLAEQETVAQLINNYPLDRDNVALAVAYGELESQPEAIIPEAEPLTLGMVQSLFVNNTDSNTYSAPRFELVGIGQYAYFWYEESPDLTPVTPVEIEFVTSNFDQIYEEMVTLFGVEPSPGADGDPRIHVVNAAPSSICDSAFSCGLLGYYSGDDRLPLFANPSSNEREMFVMNGTFFGTSSYLDTLAHEFRHMIEDNYDTNDWDWEVEGSAVLAEDLLGYPSGALVRGNMFMSNPDQQLNSWTDGNPLPYYGQGYVLNRYLYNRLGEALYREFAQHPLAGLDALDAVATANDLPFDSLSLWLDWLVALAIHTDPQADEIYRLRDGLEMVNTTPINRFPFTTETTARQYGADYYRLFGNGSAMIRFEGSSHTQLLPVLAFAGERMWVANRANSSQMQLTRTFDLTAVDSATLQYQVYHRIEYGYDFAYVAISTDGGLNWTALEGEGMQGDRPTDDPADAAYADHFYTGRSDGWQQEQIDLTPYVGQQVQIRFEYVTDPILTFDGWALDNIHIPEIGFFDGAEEDMGWQANGFVQATTYLPQVWHVQMIEYDETGVPQVRQWQIEDISLLEIETTLTMDGKRPILIIAPVAPMTLTPATYQLTISYED